MILRGIKTAGVVAGLAGLLLGCTAPLPGGEGGPFAPGNTLTFYYQSVLTDPPDQALIVECGDQLFRRSCVRQSNGATLPMEVTETGVSYGNAEQRVFLQLDPTGLPSGVGQYNSLATGETRGMRWVSLPEA